MRYDGELFSILVGLTLCGGGGDDEVVDGSGINFVLKTGVTSTGLKTGGRGS